MKARISEMETAALETKPWQLTGEIAGTGRPENSLLQEDLDFEQATKTAPVITEETTMKLEDVIKQRIKDKVLIHSKPGLQAGYCIPSGKECVCEEQISCCLIG